MAVSPEIATEIAELIICGGIGGGQFFDFSPVIAAAAHVSLKDISRAASHSGTSSFP